MEAMNNYFLNPEISAGEQLAALPEVIEPNI